MSDRQYLTAGENFEIKCSDQEIISSLVEMYSYHFRQVVESESNKDLDPLEKAYAMGTHQGAVKALEAMLLVTLGGRATYEIWEKTMKWANSGKEED